MVNKETDKDATKPKDKPAEAENKPTAKADLSLLSGDGQTASSLFKQLHAAAKDATAGTQLKESKDDGTDKKNHDSLTIAGIGVVGSALMMRHDLSQFREALPAADLADTARALNDRVGKYKIEKSDNSLPDTLVFKNPNASLSDKLKVAMTEMQASNRNGFYIEHNNDEVLISKWDDPAKVEKRYADLEARRSASGVDYRVREVGFDSTGFSLPKDVDPDKAIKATVEEAKFRSGSLSLVVNDKYLGLVDGNADVTALKAEYDKQLAEGQQKEVARQSSTDEASRLKGELGYSIKKSDYSNDFDLKLSSLPDKSKLDSVVDAAITEAKARGQSVTIKVGNESYTSVDQNSNREGKIEDFKNRIEQVQAKNEAFGLRKSIGYEYAKDGDYRFKANTLLFSAKSTPDERVKAALTEANAFGRTVNFNFDGVAMSVSPKSDLQETQARYQARWNDHISKLQAEGKPDLETQGRDLQSQLKYTVKNVEQENLSSSRAEISFRRGTSLDDKIQAATFEARARNQGLQFEDGGNKVFVRPGENPQEKLTQYQAAKDSATAGNYSIQENPYGSTILNFKEGTPADQMTAAAVAERDARMQTSNRGDDVVIWENGNYKGSIDQHTTAAEIQDSMQKSATESAKFNEQRAALQETAAGIQKELGYSISQDKYSKGTYEMEVPEKVDIESAVKAAIAEANAKDGSIELSRFGAKIYVRKDSDVDTSVADYKSELLRNQYAPDVDNFRSRLAYDITKNNELRFRADTSAEDRISAAIAEANYLKHTVNFKYDGLTTGVASGDDPEQTKAKYLQRYNEHKETESVKLAQSRLDASIKSLPDVLAKNDDRATLDWAAKFAQQSDDSRIALSFEQRKAIAAQLEDAGWKENAMLGDATTLTDPHAFSQKVMGQFLKFMNEEDGNLVGLMTHSAVDAYDAKQARLEAVNKTEGGVEAIARADVQRVAYEYGRRLDVSDSRAEFLNAVHNETARVRLLDALGSDSERRLVDDMLSKARNLDGERFKAFESHMRGAANLSDEQLEARGGMSTGAKVGLGAGLLAIASAALYFAQNEYKREQAERIRKVPKFSDD